MRRGISFKLMAAFLIYANLLPPALLLAETAKPAGVVAALKGEVLITRVALPQQTASLKFKDEVFFRDRITTKEQSLVRVLMGGKALITVRELSELTITEEPGKPSLVDLAKGKIGLAVARARMSPGESIEVRTPNAVAAVRGTVIVVEVLPAAAAPGSAEADTDYRPMRTSFTGQAVPVQAPSFVTNFHVLKGTINVTSLGQPGAPPVTIGAGLSVSVTGAAMGQPRPSPPAQQLVKDLKADPQHKGTPEETTKTVGDKQQAQATALAEAIAPKPEEKGKAKEEPKEKAKEEKAKEESTAVAKAETTTTESAPQPSETITTTTTADPVLAAASSGGVLPTGDSATTTTGTPPPTTSTTPTTPPTTTNVVLSTTGTATTTTTTTTTPAGNPPLVTIDSSTFTLGPDLASVTAGTITTTPTPQTITGLTSTTAMPLYSAVDGSDLAGAVSLSGGIKLINNTTVTAFSKNIFSVSGASATIGGTAVELTTGSSITGTSIIVVSVGSGASLEATSTAPLIRVDSSTLSGDSTMFNLSGVNTTAETDAFTTDAGPSGTGLTVGTDRPIRGTGTCPSCPLAVSLVTASGATVTANHAVKIDTALLAATMPLINLMASSTMTSNGDFVKLANQAKMVGMVPSDALVMLNNSALNVTGSLFNVAGGSFLSVTGSLFSLTSTSGNSSTLTVTNGALVALSGGSVFKLTGSFGSFSGAGTNTINLPTTLPSGFASLNTTLIPGYSVALGAGVSATQVTVTNFTPFTAGGTVTPGGVVLKVADSTSKVKLCTTGC